MNQVPSVSANGVITLLTDFGHADPFVGVLRAVILKRFPAARVVDLCHGIEPRDTAAARYWLARSYHGFPSGTTHVAVVDPAVGSARRVVAGYHREHYFVAPEGPLLPPDWFGAPGSHFVFVDERHLSLGSASATFHARDVFVPLACAIASAQVLVTDLGTPVPPPSSHHPPAPTRSGKIVVIDRFGNLITDLELPAAVTAQHWCLRLGAVKIPVRRTYSDVPPGSLVAVTNGFGSLEIACRDGSAARALEIGPGWPVHLESSADG